MCLNLLSPLVVPAAKQHTARTIFVQFRLSHVTLHNFIFQFPLQQTHAHKVASDCAEEEE